MDVIKDRDGKILHALQAALPYPWLRPAMLLEKFEQLMKSTPGLAFLDIFKLPLQKSKPSGAAIARGKTTAERSGGTSAET